MKYWIAICVWVFSLLISIPARSQEMDSLSRDSEMFFQQISAILLNTPSRVNQQNSQMLLDRLYQRWSVGRFNRDEKDAIKHLVELMRERELKSYPYLYNYIHVLTLLSESLQTPKSIIGWHAYAEGKMNGKRADRFLDFTEFTIDLLENDRFYNERSVSWYHRKARFQFELDTNFLIRYERLDLVCATRRDSSVIKKTEGNYNYDLQLWTGQSGTIGWERFGKDYGDSIYVALENYTINIESTSFDIDTAVLHYDRFFKNPILGRFSEKVMSSAPSSRTSYPRFVSFRDDFELEDVYPDITYFGGFYLNGLKLFGAPGEYNDAYLTLSHDGETVGKVRASLFRLDPDRVESQKAETVFYLEKDSIYHPGMRFRYLKEENEIQLFSEDDGDDMIPFFDAYHQLDIYSPALFWNMDSSAIELRRIQGVHRENKAAFVSSNYFSERDFYEIQGMDEFNPLYIIENYLKTYDEEEIKLNALAAYMKKSPEQVSAMLINLANRGFLVYNSREQKAIVKPRFFDFLNAKAGRRDYDVITLESRVEDGANAKINLNDLSLEVFGVPEVIISDSQDVYIYPYDESIKFRKNRDFTFDGKVHMGLFDYYSRSNTFVYDSFMINLNYIDSLVFRVYSTDSLERIDSLVKVKNIIAELNGTIYVDMPYNKSGLRDYKQYPIFVSDEDSYVYFNDPLIQDSTLLPESFYYRIDPFRFDSIKSFSTTGMKFRGTLVSAGIFPPINEPLTVMPDYSLGFIHRTPPDGYPLYGGKGRFTDTIILSNDGFTGSGKLDYLASRSGSEMFIFYPDSLVARATDFISPESPDQYNFPYVKADTVLQKWDIAEDIMTVTNPLDSFSIYRDAAFDGILTLQPERMGGDGSFFFEGSEIRSGFFSFHYTDLVADSADFYLRKDADTLVFQSNGYFAKVDFAQQHAWFNHAYENTFVEFPYNKYIANLDEVEWFMDEDKIVLFSDLSANYQALDTLDEYALIDYSLEGPEFISIEGDPDSAIRFFAGKATYNLNSYNIDVENVKLIKSADAAIFPNNEFIQIMRDGGLATMNNARIIADTLIKYHLIYDAEVDVVSRHIYYAKGYTDYIDRNLTRQQIYMMRIEVNSNGVTNGFGDMEPTEIFFLSPEYFFTGQISFTADRKFLTFSGGYRINEDCVGQEDKWVTFEKNIDPNNIYFDIDENSLDLNKNKVRYGLAHAESERGYYPLILQPTDSPGDDVLIEAFGQIDYDTATQSFRVGSEITAIDGKRDGNFVQLNTQRCILSGEGIFDLALGLNNFDVTAAGHFQHLIIPDSTYLDMAALMNFYFDDEALTMMIDSLRMVNSVISNPGEGNFPLFLRKLLGYDGSAKLITELSLYGQMEKMPKALDHTIIFSDLKMKWNQDTRSFISYGPIGIGYIAGTPVNKYVNGYVQIEKSRTSSGIDIYLELNDDQWYYLNFRNGILQAISSDMAFNDYLTQVKATKRVLNPGSDTDYYEYVISTRRKVVDFLREMEKVNMP